MKNVLDQNPEISKELAAIPMGDYVLQKRPHQCSLLYQVVGTKRNNWGGALIVECRELHLQDPEDWEPYDYFYGHVDYVSNLLDSETGLGPNGSGIGWQHIGPEIPEFYY